MTQVLILIAAFASVAIGLWLLHLSFGKRAEEFERTNLFAWVFIAMFPVLLIFSFFPESNASGKTLGFSVGGAFAGFIVLFQLGTKRALSAKKFDELRQKLRAHEAEIEALKAQIAAQAKRPEPLGQTRRMLYKINDSPTKSIGLVTGDLNKIEFASIWVNSENTNMQMSRFFEDTVSATIRYCGSKRDALGDVTEDCIGNELKALMKNKTSVSPGQVLVTGPGELATSHNVKKLYHVASVHGQRGVGYRQIPDVAVCVTNVLERAEKEPWAEGESRSIIVPLLGANVGRGDLKSTIRALFTAALDHFARHPDSSLEVVYFLAYTDRELEACTELLENEPKMSAITTP